MRIPLVLLALVLAGCTGAEVADDAVAAPEAAPVSEPLPEPIVFEGSSLAPNPAGFIVCLRDGVHGDMFDLPAHVAGWTFIVNDGIGYGVYFWKDGEYMEGGTATGVVPHGATEAEVCNESDYPVPYELVLSHPDA